MDFFSGSKKAKLAMYATKSDFRLSTQKSVRDEYMPWAYPRDLKVSG